MAGLGHTTAKLARYKRHFEKAIAATAKLTPEHATDRQAGRLQDVTGFGSNPGNLRMRVYVPENLPEGAPLVVILHGCSQTAESYDLGAGWSKLADRHGLALLFPEQVRSNNPNSCFNWFLPQDTTRDGGEALSIRQMVERMILDHRLDRGRVFVTGLSAGGAMAAVMLATYPDVFAGGAIIAGLPYGVAGNVQEALDSMYQGKQLPAASWGDLVRRASPHNGPWPKVSIWHGSADSTVQPVNARELVKQWTDVHALPAAPSLQDRVDGYPHDLWLSASGDPLVESYTITGLAHGTPIAAGEAGQFGTAGPFMLEAGISSTYRIAQFFGLVGPKQSEASLGAEPQAGPAQAGASAARRAKAGPERTKAGKPSVPLARRPAGSRATEPDGSGLLDPGAIINKALKKAGLLKG